VNQLKLRAGDVIQSEHCTRRIVTTLVDYEHQCLAHPNKSPRKVYKITDTNGRLFAPAYWCPEQMAMNGYSHQKPFSFY
jgi:hypothetical protein